MIRKFLDLDIFQQKIKKFKLDTCGRHKNGVDELISSRSVVGLLDMIDKEFERLKVKCVEEQSNETEGRK